MNISSKALFNSVLGILALTAVDACAWPYVNTGAVNWMGPYFGVSVGAGSDSKLTQTYTENDFSQSSQTTPTTSVISTSTDNSFAKLRGNATGAIADLFVGFNCQHPSWPSFVIGGQLEGTFFSDISWKVVGQLSRHSTNVNTVNPGPIITTTSFAQTNTTEFEDRLHAMVSLVARGGYLVQPNWLVYLLVGGVEGNFVTPGGEGLFAGKRSLWKLGSTVGAGVELKFNQKWSVRGEYRYLHFNVNRSASEGNTANFTQGTVVNANSSVFVESNKTRVNFNLGVVSIVYGFC